MQHLLQDIKHALRIFRESPLFAATVVTALTLGIGVNVAIFSVVDAVLLQPLPYGHPSTLVTVENTTHGQAYGPWTSPAKFAYWRAQRDVFSDVAAIDEYPRDMNYTGGDVPEQVATIRVSQSYFRVLGAPVVRGRAFGPEDDRPGGPKVAVISYDFWQRRLSGAADVLGRTLPLSGDSYTIVGILGRNFDADPYFDASSARHPPDLLIPIQIDPNTTDEANSFANLARLKPGVTLAQARAHVAASVAAFRQRFPRSLGKTDGFTVLSARKAMTTMFGDPRTRLWVLLGTVGFVLLIACANVANLLLVRATGRAHEIAIRSTLGAGRGRIARQLLTESLLLSFVGGLLGLGVGFLGIRALMEVNTAGLPRVGADGSMLGMDWRIVVFTLGLSLLTGLVFGLAPSVLGSRMDLNSVIKGSGTRSGDGLRQNRARSLLVVVEVALAVMLLIGAALLIRTSIALGRVDPGFDTAHLITMHTTFTGSQFRTAGTVTRTLRTALARVRSMPGVESAAVTSALPAAGGTGVRVFNVVGRSNANGAGAWTGQIGYVTVSDGYLDTLGIPVIRGRGFTDRDNAHAPPVVLINEAMAKRFWTSGRDPLQDRLQIGIGFKPPGGQPERAVVGIVGDVHYSFYLSGAMHGGLDQQAVPVMYVPVAQLTDADSSLSQEALAPLTWVVRTRSDSAALAERIRKAIRDATGFPVEGVEPMERVLSDAVSRQRLNMLLMSIFGGGALLLAAIGIYGLMAYSVQQRVREIGIRMALGADAPRVKRMIVREGALLAGIGIAAGLVAAFFTADVLASLLFDVKPHDPKVFVAVPLVLGSIALVSAWLPAARASRVNPLDALRYE